MKRIFTLFLIATSIGIQAQTADSVSIGGGYPNRAFYTLGTASDVTILNNNWDIAVAVYSTQTASIRINGGFGVQLFRAEAGDTTAWSTLDTAGLSSSANWLRCYDSDTSFEASAFEYPGVSFPNYGWGIYNTITHDVLGVKLFVIKTVAGTFKKVWVKNQNAVANSITIRTANLDNSNDTTFTLGKTATSKNYKYYNFTTGVLDDTEPANTSYDLMFARYETDLGGGMYYPVTGVLSNDGIKVTEARYILPVQALAVYYSTYYPSSVNMTEIGNDWKAFSGTWVIEDSLSYFVEDINGDIYQITFTGFVGSGAGKYLFNVTQAGWASVEDNGTSIANFNVYPNPAADFINVAYTIDNEFDVATLSILDLNGKLITTQKLGNNNGFNSTQIDLSALNISSGIYIANVQVGNASSTQKFIVR